jgi:replicative DNA helicase
MTTAEQVLNALQAYDLKSAGGGKYRANSPLRPGANSHSFCVVINDEEHGAYDDKTHGDHGSLYELAAKLGIETPQRLAVTETKRPYRDLADYAAAHGLTADELTPNGWGEVIEYQLRPALPFKTAHGLRYRFIDGEKPFYKSELDYKACFYGLQKAIALANEQQSALILCNGEISTLAAQKQGLAAFCVTGGERAIPLPLLHDLKAQWVGAIWLCYDCDATGRRVASDVAAQLPNATVIDLGLGDKGDLADFAMLHTSESYHALARIAVNSPKVETQMTDAELMAGALRDLSRAIRDDNAPDLETVLAQVQSTLDRVVMKISRPAVCTFADVVLQQRDIAIARALEVEANGGESPYTIEGMRSNIPAVDNVLHGFRPELYDIYGATGSGKTWFVVSLAREFVTQGAGLVVSTELEPGRWLNRLVASIARVNATDIRRGLYAQYSDYLSVRAAYDSLATSKSRILDNSSPTPAMVRAAALAMLNSGIDLQWVIVDSMSKMRYPGAATIYDRMSGVSDALQDLMREIGRPVVATNQIGRDVASMPSGKKMPQLEDGYGSGVIEQNAGVVIGLYYHHYYVKRGLESESSNFPEGVVALRFLKMRDEDDSEAPMVKLALNPGVGFFALEQKRAVQEVDF